MAVIGSTTPQFSRQVRQKYLADGLALPVCEWSCDAQATGDGSGGTLTLSCSTNVAVTGKYVWSLEEAEIANNDLTARLVTLSFTTGRLNSAGGSISRVMIGTTRVGPTLVNQGARTRFGPGVADGTATAPITRDKLVQFKTTLLSLILATDNVNTIVYTLSAWGYCWDREQLSNGMTLVRPP